MKPLRAGAIVAALALIAVLLMVWKPWDSCDAPDDVCDFLATVADRDGVLGSQVSSRVSERDALAAPELSVDVQFELSDQLAPGQAREAVTQMAQDIQAGAPALDMNEIHLSFVAGPSRKIQGSKTKAYPLEVSEIISPAAADEQAKPALLGEKAAFAFGLRHHGAASVINGSATADNLEQLLKLGEFTAQAKHPAELVLADHSVRYSATDRTDMSELQLLADAAKRGIFQNASIDNSGLNLTLGNQAPAAAEQETHVWLEQHEAFDEAMPYKLFSAGYEVLAEGWVGGKKPESLIPRPVVLPDNVTSWPQDPSAPWCAEDELDIALGTPDAAAGSRYLPVFAKNTSAGPCALRSYPQIAFLNADGDAQPDVQLQPEPGILLERVTIPAGEAVISTLEWNAMSTSLDPDETVALGIAAARGMTPVELAPAVDGQPTTLDILDGARITQSPWVQARDGWTVPSGAFAQQSPARPRP